MIVGCSPTSNNAICLKTSLFRTAAEILFTDIKLYCRQDPNIQQMLLIERSFRIKNFNVAAHFRAVSQAKA